MNIFIATIYTPTPPKNTFTLSSLTLTDGSGDSILRCCVVAAQPAALAGSLDFQEMMPATVLLHLSPESHLKRLGSLEVM